MHKAEWVYGLHSSRHVIEHSPQDIISLWFLSASKSAALQRLKLYAIEHDIAHQEVTAYELDQLCGGNRHQGVVIEKHALPHANIDLTTLLARQPNPPQFFLVLDHIQDPHNLGACLRTANAAGVTAVVVPKNRAARINATVRKIACGAVESTTVVTVVNIARAIKEMKQAGVYVVGATFDDNATPLYEWQGTSPVALILGNEGSGLRRLPRELCDELVHIPMWGRVESLNVSVACGVLLYEFRRGLCKLDPIN